MSGVLHDLLFDYTLRTVALGAAVLGVTAGALGAFALLRRQSLLGDAISHAALPGVVLAFLLTQQKAPLVLLAGALLIGWLGTLFVMLVTQYSRVKLDAALGLVLSVFFGIGLVMLTMIQNLPTAGKAGLDKFLFGNASTLLQRDVWTMAAFGALALAVLLLGWKEFKLLTFDRDFAHVLGLPVRPLDIALTTLIVIAIVIGLQTVGVVLMSAMLVAPAAAARQWSNRLGAMVALAAGFGGLSGVAGAVTSSTMRNLPTGPTIVLIVSALVLLSLLFAPARGLVWDHLRHLRQHREVRVAGVLVGLLRLVEGHDDPYHPHAAATLDAVGLHAAENTLPLLRTRGWVKRAGQMWAFTHAGYAEARRLASEQEEAP